MNFRKVGDHYINFDSIARVTFVRIDSATDALGGPLEGELTAYVSCMGVPAIVDAAGPELGYSFVLTGDEAEELQRILASILPSIT